MKQRIAALTFIFLSIILLSGANHHIAHAAATYTVNNASDTDDGECTPSHCTLREAINAANSNSGHDTIKFNFFSFTTIVLASPLPNITDQVTIDGIAGNGSSCPASATTPANLNVTISGINLPAGREGLVFDSGSDNSTVKGLNFVLVPRAAIWLHLSDGHDIICNQIGLINGNSALVGNDVYGILIHSDNNTIGGTNVADRNVISNNGTAGIRTHDSANFNVIVNNYIGTTREGDDALGGQEFGIFISGNNNFVADNVISGGNEVGIRIYNASPISSNGVYRNLIGLDQSGANGVPNAANGIEILGGASQNIVGGSVSNANTIAHNGDNGIMLDAPAATRNNLRFNSIYDNGELGIDLFDDGVTANDNPDDDLGPNKLQNYPDLTLAESTGRVAGTFVGDNVPAQDYNIDVYLNDSCSASGYGEGKTYLESFVLSSWGNVVNFDLTLSSTLPLGKYLSMTATDPNGNTSEFSQCVAVTEKTFTVNTNVNNDDSSAGDGVCDVTGASTTCSLRAVIQEVNALGGGPYKIFFDILPTKIIQPTPTTPIPTINVPVILDAVTGNGSASCPNNLFVSIDGALQGGGDGVTLGVGSGGSTIRGLSITAFTTGSGIKVESHNNTLVCNNLGVESDGTTGDGNQIGLTVTGDNNLIGGSSFENRNLVSDNSSVGAYLLSSAGNNKIYGNAIGLDETGLTGLGNGSAGIQIDGFNNQVGSDKTGTSNLISDNGGVGIFLRDTGGNNEIAGNLIGLDKNGNATSNVGNTSQGVNVASDNNIIGGETSEHGNVISDNGSHGVYIVAADGNTVSANIIGAESSGNGDAGNTGAGIRIEQGDDSVIGGDTLEEGNRLVNNSGTGMFLYNGVTQTSIENNIIGIAANGGNAGNNLHGIHFGLNSANIAAKSNLIAHNGGDGARLDSSTALIDLDSNEIYDNNGLGIDIAPVGANNPVPPVLISDYFQPNGSITAKISGDPNTLYRVDFFKSDSCDSSGFGEGEHYLQSINITTNGSGNGVGSMSGGFYLSGDFLTATATDSTPANETSEFSQCAEVCTPPSPTNPNIVIAGSNIQLSWSTDPAPTTYEIYRSVNDPYNLSIYAPSASSPWLDPDGNEVGDVDENHYYALQTKTQCGETGLSQFVGEFDFAIVPGTP